MSTETVVTPENEVVENEEVVVDSIEEKARSQGWVDKDEWHGDPDGWRPAREFVERGELMSRISYLNTKLSKVQNDLNVVAQHHAKFAAEASTQTKNALLAEKRLALEAQDFDKVIEIDNRLMETVTDTKSNNNVTPETYDARGNIAEDFEDFKSRNHWFDSDIEMTEEAHNIGTGYAQRHPEKTYQDVYKYVETKIKQMYPQKFNRDVTHSRVNSTTNTTSGNTSTRNRSKYTVDDLTHFQRKIAERCVESGACKNLQEYVDQLALVGGIEKS